MSKSLLARGPSEEIAPSTSSPPPGLLRGFTGALSALARSLARAETPAASEAEAPTEPQPSKPPVQTADAPSTALIDDSPIDHPLNSVRASLLNLLTQLDSEEFSPSETPPAQPTEPAIYVSPLDIGIAESEVTEAAAEPPGYAILSGKTIGVIGFSEARGIQLGQSLAAQRCSFVTFSHADAEFRKGATGGCDVLLIEARPEWTALGSGEVSSLLTSKKPLVLLGDPDSLLTAAIIAQGGPREFVPSPGNIEDLIWRTAILLSSIPGPKARGKKRNKIAQVIIGDDDPSSRTLVHAILAQEGMKCHAADNGAQALALARAKSADVVVVDVNMAGLDGFQVLAEIKRDPALSSARVILLTTRQGEADVLRGFGLGADDYVTKPFSPLELAARVKRLLARPA